MKLGQGAGPLPSVPGDVGGRVGRSDSGRRWLDIAVDRRKDAIGERETKRAMPSYCKLGVGEKSPSPMSWNGASSTSSNPSASASSGMAVDETLDQRAKRVRLGSALRRQPRRWSTALGDGVRRLGWPPGPRHGWARGELHGGKSVRSGEGIGTSVEATPFADEVGASGRRGHGVHMGPVSPPAGKEHGGLLRGELGRHRARERPMTSSMPSA